MNRFLWTPELLERLRAGMVSGKSSRDVAADMGVTQMSVRTAARRHKLGSWLVPEPSNRIAAPGDLAEQAARVTSRRQLQRHYDVSHNTVGRWLREAGIDVAAPPPSKIKPKPIQHGITEHMGRRKSPSIIGEPIRDLSGEGQAADFLRRYGPVYRYDGGWWRGSSRLTGAELIERAVGKGWVR